MMAPAMLLRPENYNTGTESTGLFDFAEAGGDGGGGSLGEKAKKAKKADSSSPVTVMASAFGAQGGFVDAGGSGSGTTYGGQGDPWLYTETPRGNITSGKKMSKYPGGTASGGVIFHPPETDLRDIDAGMVPANVTLSTTRVMCAPGASFGVGIPNLETGSIKTGADWEYDSATGDVVWHTYSFTTESEAIRLTNPAQLIRWMSGQSFYGEFSHTNTANRTWTFPDVTSTISSILFDTVAPTAVATEGTFGWDTVANNLYVNNDGATGWTFVGGASSVTGSGANTRVAFWTSATVLSSDTGLTYNSTTDALTVSGSVTVSGLTATHVLYAGTAGLISGEAAFTYNAGQDRLILSAANGPRLTAEVTGTANHAIEISNTASGDAFIGYTSGGTTFSAGFDQSALRYAIAKTSTLGTASDLFRLTTDGNFSYVGQAVSTGAAVEFTHHDFNVAGGTIILTTGATLATQRAVRFRRPEYAADAATQTITSAATLYIENAPAAGTNVAITNPYALWVDDGAVRLDGWANIGTTTDATAQGDFAAGVTGALRMAWKQSTGQLRVGAITGTVTSVAPALGIDGDFPGIFLRKNDEALNAKLWRMQLSTGGTWNLDVRDDADTGASSAIKITRSTTTPSSIILNEDGCDCDLRIEGDNDPNLGFFDASTDRVGIGLGGPRAKLDVYGNDSSNGLLNLTYASDGGAATIAWTNNAGTRLWRMGGGVQVAQSEMSFDEGTTSRLYLKAGGNVGIGTTGPDAKLDVLSTSTQLRLTYTDGSIWRDAAVDSSSNLKITSPTSGDCTFELEVSRTITGAVTDGYAGSLLLDPAYDAATAQTVTRHNYIDVQNPALTGAGPAALTDACVFRFDAAAGTHKAVDSGTTKTTPGTVDAWVKVNINGTVYYQPCYTSKTS